MSVEAYWSDDNYEANCKKIQHDLNNIINVLKYGACVFIEQNFLSGEANSPMNTECPKTKEFLLDGIQLLQSRYRPRIMSKRKRSTRNAMGTKYRSNFEVGFASDLIKRGVSFDYEPDSYEYVPNPTTYTPDFYIPEHNFYVETKGVLYV